MTPRVALLVLSYNGVDLTLNCLASLCRSDYPQLDVILVDNASQDNTVEAVRAAFPQVHVIPLRENLGYAAGNNVGIQAALDWGADYVFLINNDTTLEADCVSILVRTAQANPRIGMLGPMVYTWEEGHVISSAGGVVDWHSADAYNLGAGEVDRGQYPAGQVDFINGCGLMVTRAAIERAGMLDTKFFMYWEETDWCLRVRKAGFDVWFEPAARMRHKAPIHHQDLGPTTLYYVTRNRLLFCARHAPFHLKPIMLVRALRGAYTGARRHEREGRPEHARATRWAMVHAFQRRWGKADATLWHSDATDRSLHSASKPSVPKP
jgi:hypothetical protein